MVDRNGHARLAPGIVFIHYRNFFGYLFPGAAFVIIGWYFFSLAMTFSGVPMTTSLLALAAGLAALLGLYIVNSLRRGATHRRPLREASERISASVVTTIASASGRSRIRGRVRVIEPVSAPTGERAAAYLLRVREGLTGRRNAITGVAIRQASGSGTFMVEDETGAALVDDDAFTVLPLDVSKYDWNTPLRILIQDGDEVEVLGPAARRPQTGDAPSLLVFDGTPTERVLILARPTALA